MKTANASKLAAIALTVLLAACATNSQVEELDQQITDLQQQITDLEQAATDARQDITGIVITNFSRNFCRTSRDEFVRDGDYITIHDGSDATLAIDRIHLVAKVTSNDTCTFRFTFPDVPTDKGFYRIRLDDIRWDLNQADLEEDDWTLTLNIKG